MKLIVYALGIAGILFIVTAVLMDLASRNFKPVTLAPGSACPTLPDDSLPGGFKGRVIAIEFARSVCDVELIVGADNHVNRAVMKRVLNLDTFFILAYSLLYILLGFLLTQGGSHWAMWLGVAAIICGIGTAAFDLIENASIRQVVNSPLAETTPEMVVAIRDATLVKWSLSFVTSILLAAALFYMDVGGAGCPRWLGIASSFFFIAGALVGFVALRHNKLIPLTVWLQLPGLLGLIYLALRCPQVFLWKM